MIRHVVLSLVKRQRLAWRSMRVVSGIADGRGWTRRIVRGRKRCPPLTLTPISRCRNNLSSQLGFIPVSGLRGSDGERVYSSVKFPVCGTATSPLAHLSRSQGLRLIRAKRSEFQALNCSSCLSCTNSGHEDAQFDSSWSRCPLSPQNRYPSNADNLRESFRQFHLAQACLNYVVCDTIVYTVECRTARILPQGPGLWGMRIRHDRIRGPLFVLYVTF